MKSVFFIPVWNQIYEFRKVLAELKSTDLPCHTILLVNNGSDDGSEHLVRNSGYPYIDVPANLGIGHSFIKAIDWALERDYDLFGSMAANGKMLPAEMHKILEPLLSNNADYVTGSRFLNGGQYPNLPLFRRLSIPMVNILVWLLTGARLTDATCGYRAMRLDMFKQANFDWHASWLNAYGFEYYAYAKVILDRHMRWKEVPITMRYPAKGNRYSKIKPVKGWYDMLKPWIVARLDRKGFAKLNN